MYMSYLLSIVEYASVVWDECTEQYLLTLHNVQNEAALLVTGLTRSVSLEKNSTKSVDGQLYHKNTTA